MKTMKIPVLAVLVASAVIVGGGNSTRAETGDLTVNAPRSNYMTDTTVSVEKRDVVITRLFLKRRTS